MFVGASLTEAQVHTLERYTAQKEIDVGRVAWQIVDLLREPSNGPWSALLQDTLRCRRNSLFARLTVTPSGLAVYELGTRRVMSFCREKALTEALIILAAAEFYRGTDALNSLSVCAGGYASFTETALEELLAERLATVKSRHSGDIPMLMRKIRCWGIAVWIGDVDEAVVHDR